MNVSLETRETAIFGLRQFAPIKGIAVALGVFAAVAGPATARDNQASEGEKAAAEAPLQMLVSLDEQKIDVYRGTELLQSAPISSGKPGNSTPTGVFSILEKRRKHFSNLYNNAPMPFMQRLTWSGIALHQGRLPGYPASHGCIRMPRDFAKDLFGQTERGMHVVVTRGAAAPELIRHDVLPQPLPAATTLASLSSTTIAADPALRGSLVTASIQPELNAAAAKNPKFDQPLRMIVTPKKSENQTRTLQRLLNQMGFNAGPVDGVMGRKTRAAIALYQEGAERPVTGKITDSLIRDIHAAAGYEKPQNATLRIRRKFKDIYEAPVTLADIDAPIGTHVFTALGFEQGAGSVDWMAVPAEGESHGTPRDALDRLTLPEKVQREISEILTPGTSLIITDRSFARNTGLGTDFVVVTR
ncbi:L,D-transpeptidase [uncultured Roseibium sp.]|uniref:L,D-transpeptidase n=1 Tax=uncultured Roseibium sp. TaxID=1936171 RepID=UPI002593873F|nr:L,D-transpeptidase [uncultured Roseibium sp.]